MTIRFVPPSATLGDGQPAPAVPLGSPGAVRRRILVTAAVVGLHAAGIAAFQGLPMERPAVTVPHVVAAQVIAPASNATPAPAPTASLPKPTAPRAPTPERARTPAPPTTRAAEPVAPPPAPVGPEAVEVAATPAPSTASAVEPAAPSAHVTAGLAPVTAAPAPAPPRIELPSATAAYLNNPPPAYPALSRRLGEEGRVVLRVRIEPDGTASAAEIRTSSGYERLDQAALQAVLRWRYVPGMRNGVPEAMWFLVPIQFQLQ